MLSSLGLGRGCEKENFGTLSGMVRKLGCNSEDCMGEGCGYSGGSHNLTLFILYKTYFILIFEQY